MKREITEADGRVYRQASFDTEWDNMIGHLHGKVFEKHPNQVIIETGGVGYEVQIPISTYTVLPDSGGAVSLRIFTHVREDALVLYGFATTEEKAIFEKLISVSGIGPKLGLTVLSGLPVSDLVAAIRTNDVARLVRIPGVGKKTAERLALELKDKLTHLLPEAGKPAATGPAQTGFSALEQDVLSALQNLGCSRAAAEDALRKVVAKGTPEHFEDLFRAAMAVVR